MNRAGSNECDSPCMGDQTNDTAFEEDEAMQEGKREKRKGSTGEKREMRAPFSRGPLALFRSSACWCRRNLTSGMYLGYVLRSMYGLWIMDYGVPDGNNFIA